MRAEIPTDEALMEHHLAVRKAWDVVCVAERERDRMGKPVRQALVNIDRIWRDGSNEQVREENDLTHDDDVEVTTDPDMYLRRLLDKTGVLGSVASAPIATFLLGSPDPDYDCNLRHIPHVAVTVDRCLAHVAAMNLPVDRETESRVARMATLALLNCASTRHARRLPDAGPDSLKADADAENPLDDEPAMATQTRSVADLDEEADDQALAPEGRVVTGYVKLIKPCYFVVSGQHTKIDAGTPLVRLSPTESEQRDARFVPVVWNGKATRVYAEQVVTIRRTEYWQWTKGQADGSV